MGGDKEEKQVGREGNRTAKNRRDREEENDKDRDVREREKGVK